MTVFFIPLYLAAAILLWKRHRLGVVLGCVASGGVRHVLAFDLAAWLVAIPALPCV